MTAPAPEVVHDATRSRRTRSSTSRRRSRTSTCSRSTVRWRRRWPRTAARLRRGELVRIRPALGIGRDGRARPCSPTRTRRSCGCSMRAVSARRGRIPSGLSCADGATAPMPACTIRPGRPTASPRAAPAEVVRAAKFYMAAQVETGHLCPITMTRASVGGARRRAGRAGEGDAEHRHPRLRSVVRAVVDQARHHARHGHDREAGRHRRARQPRPRAERDGDAYRITGHKWFMSAPMCDAFLVLAQATAGLTCFLHAALPARRLGQRHAFPAAEGQARQPLQRVVRGRIRRRLCAARRRGRAGHPHHHPDGAADAARLRDRLGRLDAHGARAGAASCAPSQRVPEASRRSADDAHGARRHGAACRGVDRAGDAAMPRVRSSARRTRRRRRGCGC